MNIILNYRTIKVIIVLILAIVPLALKMLLVDNFLHSYTGIRLFGATQVLANDAIIFSAVMLLLYLSYLSRMPYIASILLRVLSIFVVFLYAVDVYVIRNFNTHLVVTDVIKYASYSLKYIQQTHNGKGFLLLIIMIVVVGFMAQSIFSKYKIKNNSTHRYSIIMVLSIFFISNFADKGNDKYVHSWVYKNFINYNLIILSEAKEYSNEFIKNFRFSEKELCYSKIPEKRNIILLMVESLSSYQSSYFSGIKNWTPNLDIIASKNISYKNFYANGFTTEDGEISLLTGKLPIYRPSSYTNGGGTSFNGFFGVEESLPNILKKKRYTTDFLTTADLSFANTGEWAKSVGFNYIEGHEYPYYEKWDRFHFKAAPDEALYNRVLDRINHHDNNNFFIFIKTVSTHHPFINPENKNKSEAEAFKYADKQIGLFYKKLIDMGYFDKGMLIIVGDHHSMVPLKNEEVELFGSLKASAKVPMIVSYGDKNHSIVNEQYQQIDIFNSLKGLVSNTQCSSNWTGDILSGNPAQYIAHRRGDNRNIISVFSENKDYSIKLDGDNTRLTTNDTDIEIQELIIKKINAIRISSKSHQ
ncbi:MAG: sulfatase-like hydrolase/transferase [Methyloprofundus sp.]|nr:sulfatase-like hydrolase/transferase [Methyloprofundus sp.]